MFEVMRRALTAGAVVAAVGALAAASAGVADAGTQQVASFTARDPTGTPVPSIGMCARRGGHCVSPTQTPIRPPVVGVGICARRAGRCLHPTNHQVDTSDARPTLATATSQDGFQWDDAGLGAAGMLLLLSAGGAAMIVGRRPHHRATTH
jgi:hypothetical protein